MAVGSLDNETVNLEPGLLKMSQPVDMPIFQLTDWNLDKKIFYGNKPGISMVLVMKRRITSEMMTTYFPTLLLTAITFATTFFKPFFFEAALSVNLTTMLVMTTIFISKMEGLPPTSDIKLIDVWLVLCQMMPFAEVVLLTAMEYHRKDGHEEDGSEVRDILIGSKVVQMSSEDSIEDDFKENPIPGCCTPSLKTLGDLHLNRNLECTHDKHVVYCILIHFLSEKKVLPSLVLISFIVYFANALMFYFDL